MFDRTLVACLFASAAQAMPSVDKGVWRPASWEGVLKQGNEQVSSVGSSIVGHGLAQPYVLPCETATFEHEEKAYECYRLYLLLNKKICETMYAIYGNEYSGISIKTEDGETAVTAICSCHVTLLLHTGSQFFQAKAGIGVDVGGVGPALFEFVPAAAYDSWLTIGAHDATGTNKISLVGFPDFKDTGTIETANGAVYAADPGEVPPTTAIPKELEGRKKEVVLIGQLSVEKGTIFNLVINAQGKTTSAVTEVNRCCVLSFPCRSGQAAGPLGDHFALCIVLSISICRIHGKSQDCASLTSRTRRSAKRLQSLGWRAACTPQKKSSECSPLTAVSCGERKGGEKQRNRMRGWGRSRRNAKC